MIILTDLPRSQGFRNTVGSQGHRWFSDPPRGRAGNYAKSLNVDDYDYTSPVGSFVANEFGLYDMGGNAWQWCEDWYDSSKERCRVARGGSCYEREEERLLASCRNETYPQYRYVDYGFRVVLAGTLQ